MAPDDLANAGYELTTTFSPPCNDEIHARFISHFVRSL